MNEFIIQHRAGNLDDPSTKVLEGFGMTYYKVHSSVSYLNRFPQPDSIIQPGAQGLDRYAAMNNNPVRYRDPSGHRSCDDTDKNGNCISWRATDFLNLFGIKTKGLREDQKWEAFVAAEAFGRYFNETYGSQYGFSSTADAFKKVPGRNVRINSDPARQDCNTVDAEITCGTSAMTTKAFVHEFFHAMDKAYQRNTDTNCPGGNPCLASNYLPPEYSTDPSYTNGAYRCTEIRCVSHPYNLEGYDSSEAFANAGENLVLGALNIDPANNGFKSNRFGNDAKSWMNNWMPSFLDTIVGVK